MGKVLVTGGTGYIGSHTVVELIQAGHEVEIIDNLSNSDESVLDGIERITKLRPVFYNADLRNIDDLFNLLSVSEKYDAVIHFAAFKAVGESVENPILYYENNIVSLLNLIKFQRERKIPNIVFSSSCTVYGEPDQLPVDENTPIKKATSPYGNTKQIAEEIIQDSIVASDIQGAILLRYFNPIGAHRSALIGELPLGVPNNLVPFITQTAIGIRDRLSVFGNDYHTTDGTCIRDYIDVVDLAKAHVKAVERLIKMRGRDRVEVFNLGTGKGRSVLEVVHAFISATGVDLNYEIVDRRPGDVEKVYADARKANQVLDWFADTPLEETLKSAWEWEKHYRNVKLKENK